MIAFIAPLMVVFAATLLLFWWSTRRVNASVSTKEANKDWLEMRKSELLAEDESLTQEAALRLLEEGFNELPEVINADQKLPFRVYVAVAVVLCLVSAALYVKLGASQDLTIARQLQQLEVDADPQKITALALQLEARLVDRPENTEYLGLLGSYYMGQADYSRAAEIYQRLVELVPEAPQVLAYAAQARYLGNGRVLDTQARLWAEQAISISPTDQTALGLLGMAAFEAGAYQTAVDYWSRLQSVLRASGNEVSMIDDLLQQARQAVGDAAPPTVLVPQLVVEISLPETHSADGASVYVVLRAEGASSGMPLAVKRLAASDLPSRVIFSDQDSMAGQTLSSLTHVSLSAHVSLVGDASSKDAPYLAPPQLSVELRQAESVIVRLAPRNESLLLTP